MGNKRKAVTGGKKSEVAQLDQTGGGEGSFENRIRGEKRKTSTQYRSLNREEKETVGSLLWKKECIGEKRPD